MLVKRGQNMYTLGFAYMHQDPMIHIYTSKLVLIHQHLHKYIKIRELKC